MHEYDIWSYCEELIIQACDVTGGHVVFGPMWKCESSLIFDYYLEN